MDWIQHDRQQLTDHQYYQALLDQSTPHVLYRWVGTAVGLLLFFLRVFVAQGWYIGKLVGDPISETGC